MTEGEKHDLNGSDFFMKNLVKVKNVLADRAYNSNERLINKLKENHVNIVIPDKKSSRNFREHNKNLYKIRHMIENF